MQTDVRGLPVQAPRQRSDTASGASPLCCSQLIAAPASAPHPAGVPHCPVAGPTWILGAHWGPTVLQGLLSESRAASGAPVG